MFINTSYKCLDNVFYANQLLTHGPDMSICPRDNQQAIEREYVRMRLSMYACLCTIRQVRSTGILERIDSFAPPMNSMQRRYP